MSEPETASADDVFCREHAEEIRKLARRSADDIIEIGRRLAEVKERLPHGQWLGWIEAELGWSASTAERFMGVHRLTKFGKLQNLSLTQIDVSALYLLAKPSTPPAVIEAVAARVEKGEPSPHKVVRAMLHEVKAAEGTEVKRSPKVTVAEAVAATTRRVKYPSRDEAPDQQRMLLAHYRDDLKRIQGFVAARWPDVAEALEPVIELFRDKLKATKVKAPALPSPRPRLHLIPSTEDDPDDDGADPVPPKPLLN
jgi:hypothetical protein